MRRRLERVSAVTECLQRVATVRARLPACTLGASLEEKRSLTGSGETRTFRGPARAASLLEISCWLDRKNRRDAGVLFHERTSRCRMSDLRACCGSFVLQPA